MASWGSVLMSDINWDEIVARVTSPFAKIVSEEAVKKLALYLALGLAGLGAILLIVRSKK